MSSRGVPGHENLVEMLGAGVASASRRLLRWQGPLRALCVPARAPGFAGAALQGAGQPTG